MDIAHNDLVMLKMDAFNMPEGIYRVIAVLPENNLFCSYYLPNILNERTIYSGARNLYFSKFTDIDKLIKENSIIPIEDVKTKTIIRESQTIGEEGIVLKRNKVMEDFLNLEILYDHLVKYKTLRYLVDKNMTEFNISYHSVWKYISLLAMYGWFKESLLTGYDKCGAPGKPRFSDDGQRINGRHSGYDEIISSQKKERKYHQVGITEDDNNKIILAYEKLFRNKKWPCHNEMYQAIINYAYVKKLMLVDGNKLELPSLEKFKYPNKRQVIRICKRISHRYGLGIHRKSKHQILLKAKPLFSSSQSLVKGPGHVYAIDATIGDTYLVCSWDRTKELGRPTVYFIVDVYSSAIVSFYVGLQHPSKRIMDLSLFNIGCPMMLMDKLRGFEGRSAFKTEVLKPVVLLSDNGEAKQRKVSLDAFAQQMHQQFAPPYRGDMKADVEVKFSLLTWGMAKFPGSFNKDNDNYERINIKKQASLTLHDYRKVIDNWVYLYNTTADRTNLLTPELISLGCDGTPASIYDSGKIFSRSGGRFDLNSSLQTYLPSVDAVQTAYGIEANGLYYSNEDEDATSKAIKARNQKRTGLKVIFHPDSLDQIWVPNASGTGYTEIRLSDKSKRVYQNYSYWEYQEFENVKKLLKTDITHNALLTGIAIDNENEGIVKESVKSKKHHAEVFSRRDHLTLNERRDFEKHQNSLEFEAPDDNPVLDQSPKSIPEQKDEIDILRRLAGD